MEIFLQSACLGIFNKTMKRSRFVWCHAKQLSYSTKGTAPPNFPESPGAETYIERRDVKNPIRKIARNTKNRIFAIPAAAPATAPNPITPAIIAITKKIIDQCNEFLRGELSAVETYDLALNKVKTGDLATALRQLRDAHDERVGILRQKLRELAADPSESSGAWGAFAKAIQAGADLFGNGVAIAALEEGEDHGMKMYTDALSVKEPVLLDLVNSKLLPAQRKSHDLCRTLKRFVKAA